MECDFAVTALPHAPPFPIVFLIAMNATPLHTTSFLCQAGMRIF